MTVTDWVQAIAIVLLVIVTGIYAWRTFAISKGTEKQAEASTKMAEEMREQRHDAVRPVVRIEAQDSRKINISCTNVGTGPALNLRCWIEDKEHPEWRDRTKALCLSALAGRGEHRAVKVDTQIEGYTVHEGRGYGYLRAQYEDVFGKPYESRLISSTNAAPELQYFEVEKEEDIVTL
ncbi:MAG: hypothetical protein ACE5IE_02460 [Dehalococcoidia bacterium]